MISTLGRLLSDQQPNHPQAAVGPLPPPRAVDRVIDPRTRLLNDTLAYDRQDQAA